MTRRRLQAKITARILVSLGITAFLAFSPRWLLQELARRQYVEFLTRPPAAWHGRIELWHIAEFRVYQGSVTDYLQSRADAYCKRHTGVHIDVTGLTVSRFEERIARGDFPDAYSFPAGLIYSEQLTAIKPELPALRGKIAPATVGGEVYAVPYLMSGWLLAANTALLTKYRLALPDPATPEAMQALLQAALKADDKNPQLAMPPVLAARMGLMGTFAEPERFAEGKAALAVLDARGFGDLLRSEKTALPLAALPFTNYTDEVQYIGASRKADAKRAEIVADFAAFLLSDREQQRLSTLGALSVTKQETPLTYADETLETLDICYASPVLPEPFLYQRHKQALLEEAAQALCGDAAAISAFLERMQVVENGILW